MISIWKVLITTISIRFNDFLTIKLPYHCLKFDITYTKCMSNFNVCLNVRADHKRWLTFCGKTDSTSEIRYVNIVIILTYCAGSSGVIPTGWNQEKISAWLFYVILSNKSRAFIIEFMASALYVDYSELLRSAV